MTDIIELYDVAADEIEAGDQIIIEDDLIEVRDVLETEDINEVLVKGYSHTTGGIEEFPLYFADRFTIWSI